MSYETTDGVPSGESAGATISWGPAVQNDAALQAVPKSERYDKQQRLVEDTGSVYRYDDQASSGNIKPTDSDGTGTGTGNGWWITVSAGNGLRVIGLSLDNAGSVLQTGTGGAPARIPWDATILGWYLSADVSGSIQIDVWAASDANFPPDNADSICGDNEPALSAQQKDSDTTLTGWTKTLSAGDWVWFNVDSIATVKRVNLQLLVQL